MIATKKRHEYLKIHVMTKSGASTGDNRLHGASMMSNQLNGAKKIDGLLLRKSMGRQPTSDPKNEKEVFMEARNDFQDLGASRS